MSRRIFLDVARIIGTELGRKPPGSYDEHKPLSELTGMNIESVIWITDAITDQYHVNMDDITLDTTLGELVKKVNDRFYGLS